MAEELKRADFRVSFWSGREISHVLGHFGMNNFVRGFRRMAGQIPGSMGHLVRMCGVPDES